MIQLDTYPLNDQDLKNRLERIGDLINIDGPMLSLFKDNLTNNLYLFDWIDNDELYNRWLIIRVEPNFISLFINKKISYKQLFDSVSQYYVTDIKGNQNPPFVIQKIGKLPTEYYPNVNSFFDEFDAKNLHKITSVLDGLLGENKKNGISVGMWDNLVVYHLEPYYSIEKQRLNSEVESHIPNTVTDNKYSSILLPQNDNKPNKFLRPAGLAL